MGWDGRLGRLVKAVGRAGGLGRLVVTGCDGGLLRWVAAVGHCGGSLPRAVAVGCVAVLAWRRRVVGQWVMGRWAVRR